MLQTTDQNTTKTSSLNTQPSKKLIYSFIRIIYENSAYHTFDILTLIICISCTAYLRIVFSVMTLEIIRQKPS